MKPILFDFGFSLPLLGPVNFPAYFTLYWGKEPPRIGASHAAIAPYGPFECGDGEIIFLGLQNEREWERFCEIVLSVTSILPYLV